MFKAIPASIIYERRKIDSKQPNCTSKYLKRALPRMRVLYSRAHHGSKRDNLHGPGLRGGEEE